MPDGSFVAHKWPTQMAQHTTKEVFSGNEIKTVNAPESYRSRFRRVRMGRQKKWSTVSLAGLKFHTNLQKHKLELRFSSKKKHDRNKQSEEVKWHFGTKTV